MNKSFFKITDAKGRITIPGPIRASLGIANGDVVAITAERGRITIKKAIVLEDSKMPVEAKIAYVETVAHEMDDSALTNLLELAVRLLQERKTKS